VAKADAKQMVCSIDHMPKKVANQIIAAAKVSDLHSTYVAFIHVYQHFIRFVYESGAVVEEQTVKR